MEPAVTLGFLHHRGVIDTMEATAPTRAAYAPIPARQLGNTVGDVRHGRLAQV